MFSADSGSACASTCTVFVTRLRKGFKNSFTQNSNGAAKINSYAKVFLPHGIRFNIYLNGKQQNILQCVKCFSIVKQYVLVKIMEILLLIFFFCVNSFYPLNKF